MAKYSTYPALTTPSRLDKVLTYDASANGERLVAFDLFQPVWNAKLWGATGDGVTNDAPSIEAASLALSAIGGGTLYFPQGVYVLGSVSTNPNSHNSMVVARDNVSIIGSGIGSTVFFVASGMNAQFFGANGPNIFATEQTHPLTNCRFSDFTVDWNGANNLITGGMLARNNASIFSLHGGLRVVCERLLITGTPGNQCIFFPIQSDLGQGDITVRDCVFLNSGSGLTGNTSSDHSSVYLNGDRIRVVNCTFSAGQRVNGTCFELHGSDAYALGCKGHDYTLSFYVATDIKALRNATVEACYFDDLSFCIGYSCPVHAFDNVTVRGCTFIQKAGITYSVGQTFAVGNIPAVVCNSLIIDGCTFTGQSITNARMMLIDRIRYLTITNSRFSGFIDLGIWFGGDTVGSSRAIDGLNISDNFFNEVLTPIYFNVPGQQFGTVSIRNNAFLKAASTADTAITFVATAGGKGRIGGNNIVNYTGGVGGISAAVTGLFIEDYQFGTYTPTVNGLGTAGTGNYTTRLGEWTKIGNRIFLDIYVVYTGHTGTGGLSITLPTGVAAPSGAPVINLNAVGGIYSTDIALDAAKQLTGLVAYGGPYITLLEMSSGAPTQLAMSAAGTLVIHASYIAST